MIETSDNVSYRTLYSWKIVSVGGLASRTSKQFPNSTFFIASFFSANSYSLTDFYLPWGDLLSALFVLEFLLVSYSTFPYHLCQSEHL